MACIGSIQETKVPQDIYIAGLENEGTETLAVPGQILYLNGPRVSSLKTGTVQRVVRLEGSVSDPWTRAILGTYYKDIGTIQIEAVERGSASARVVQSCEGMLKGDLVLPNSPKPVVEFSGSMSNALTPIPHGLSSSILLAKNDTRELSAGQFCFIQLGTRQGVGPGDRFTIFRSQPEFNPRDMDVGGPGIYSNVSPIRGGFSGYNQDSTLKKRTLPPKVLGDLVIVEAGEGFSTGKIVNSMSEIHPGDLVVKR